MYQYNTPYNVISQLYHRTLHLLLLLLLYGAPTRFKIAVTKQYVSCVLCYRCTKEERRPHIPAAGLRYVLAFSHLLVAVAPTSSEYKYRTPHGTDRPTSRQGFRLSFLFFFFSPPSPPILALPENSKQQAAHPGWLAGLLLAGWLAEVPVASGHKNMQTWS